MDHLDEDILDVFVSHIPEEDAGRKAALLERIQEYRDSREYIASENLR